MRRWIMLILLLLCSAFVEMPSMERCAETEPCFASTECATAQLAQADDRTDSAERVTTISVNIVNAATTLARTTTFRVSHLPTTIHAVASGLGYIVGYYPYRLSCRAIDYYLYTLCCLRL